MRQNPVNDHHGRLGMSDQSWCFWNTWNGLEFHEDLKYDHVAFNMYIYKHMYPF